MALLGKMLVTLGLDTAEFDGGVTGAKAKMNNFSGEMTKVGGVLTAGITAPLVAVGYAALDASTKLNSGLANVQSLGLTQQRVEELKTGVQDLAIEVAKGTDDMTAGLYQVESAFGDGAETMKDLEINAKAAAAGLATTKEAIDLTSAVTKGYGDTTAAAIQQVADLALRTVQLGQTTFPELAGSIGAVVPLAKQLTVSQQELFAVMATATGVTGSASEVATQMRGTLQSLMAPTKDMADLMHKLGFANGEAMVKSLGYKGTLEAIVNAANATHTPLQKYLSSIEGQTLALTLAGAQSATYDSKLKQLQDAAGTTQQAFEAQTQGINKNGFAMAQAKEKVEVLLQRLGDGLGPALSAAATAAQPLIDKALALATQFTQLDPQTQQMIVTIAALAAAAGPVTVAIGGLVAAVAALMSPITLVVLAVVGLGIAWETNFLGIRDKTAAAVTVVGAWFEKLKSWTANVMTVLTNVGNAISKVERGDISLNFTPPAWITNLMAWLWPKLPPVEWVVKLLAWTFPVIAPVVWIVALTNWLWPTPPDQPSWIERLVKWVWPDFEMPGWLERLFSWTWPTLPSLPSWLGGSGGSSQGNDKTDNKETQSRKISIGSYALPAMATAGSPTINIGPVTISNGMDIEELTWKIAKALGRK